jgi:predicted thioesterase
VSHKAKSLEPGSTVKQNTTAERVSGKGINIIGASYKQDQTTAGNGSCVPVGTAVSFFAKNVIKSASSMKSVFKTYPQLT